MKKKKNSRRILLLFIMTLFLAVLGTTSSYAWFTANKTITVEAIEVNVSVQGGIQISADGRLWSSHLSTAEIANPTYYTTNVNQLPETLEAVSSGLTLDPTTGRMGMYHGNVDTSYSPYRLSSVKLTDTQGTTGHYVAFDVFIKADSDAPLFLTTSSNVSVPLGQDDTGIKNAARVAFVELGHTENIAATEDVYQTLLYTDASNRKVRMWEPNYDVHTDAAVAHALSTYGAVITKTGGSRVNYDGVDAEFTVTDPNPVLVSEANATIHSTRFKAVPAIYQTTEAFPSPISVWTVPRGVMKMRWYMWIEGQDYDCENDASGGRAVFNIQLNTN